MCVVFGAVVLWRALVKDSGEAQLEDPADTTPAGRALNAGIIKIIFYIVGLLVVLGLAALFNWLRRTI
jgi:hypothetical protein